MTLLERQVEANSRTGAWESITVTCSKSQVDVKALARLRKPLGVTKNDQVLQRAVMFLAAASMTPAAPLQRQLQQERVIGARWVNDPRKLSAGKGVSFKAPRWQISLILSLAPEPLGTPEAFVAHVIERFEAALKPALLGT